MADVSENWSDREFQPGEFAQRGWLVTGVANEREAIIAVGAEAQKGASFLLDGSLIADAPRCVREKGPLAFHVVTQYRANEISGGGGPTPGGDTATQFEYEEGGQSVGTDVDGDNVPILNAAGFPFASKVQDDQPLNFIVATRFENSYDLALSLAYKGAINSDRVRILGYWVDPGQARLLSYRPTHPWNESTRSFRNAYRFEVTRGRMRIQGRQEWDGFYHRILNSGYMGWYEDRSETDASGEPVSTLKPGRFCNGDGEPLSEPTLLDKKGKPLSDEVYILVGNNQIGDPAEFQTMPDKYVEDAGDAIFLKYPKAPRLPFRALGIFR